MARPRILAFPCLVASDLRCHGHLHMSLDHLQNYFHVFVGHSMNAPELSVSQAVRPTNRNCGSRSSVLGRVNQLVGITISSNLEIFLARDPQTEATLPHAAVNALHLLKLPRCKAANQAVAVQERLGQAVVNSSTHLLPGNALYLWVPMEVNLAERPARHFLLAPVDQPVATAALRIWTLDPDFARSILDDGIDLLGPVHVYAESEHLVPGFTQNHWCHEASRALPLHSLHLRPPAPGSDDVEFRRFQVQVQPLLLQCSTTEAEASCVHLRRDVVGSPFITKDICLVSSALLEGFRDRFARSCFDEAERDRAAHVHLIRLGDVQLRTGLPGT
mmetsp:Transcript_61741/g.144580  ORF Transcript_61741/g.144580 Transcript_61741/m.144580 type:complete len:332 (+) Transcript_61741:513-1508(+)